MTENILFITSTRIGDAVLSTGVLNHLLKAYPTAQVTIACGPLVASLFEGVPRLQRLIPLAKRTWKRHWISLWADVVPTRWDVVVDLRDSAVSRLIRADRRYIFSSSINRNQHKVMQNADVIKQGTSPPAPCLFLTTAQMEKAIRLIPDGAPVLGIGPTANWVGKIWPPENFISLLDSLLTPQAKFNGWRVAVFAAPGEEEIAQQVYNALPEGQRIDLIAKGTPGDAAACLARCQFYIGHDSGLMHCAAAAGVPTLGLFGPTNDKVYGPYGPQSRLVRTEQSFEDLTGAPDFVAKNIQKTLMDGLSVEKVLRAVNAM